VNSKDEKVLKSCLKHIKLGNLIFEKVNLSLMSYVHNKNGDALKLALEKFPLIQTVDG